MKKFLLAVAALLCAGSVAMAGVNANGTILFHYNATATGTDGNFSGYGGLTACDQAVTEAPAGAGLPGAWFAYAAFLPDAHPRVAVITAGVLYDGANIFISTWGKTADGELPTTTPPWPTPGSGIAVQWDHAVQQTLFEWYWFTGYGYAGYQLCLGPHPTQGGGFTDDSIPATTDPITAYGCLGFGTPGVLACPVPTAPTGACCNGTVCTIMTQQDCVNGGGTYQGDGTLCDPNPCLPPPPTGACCNAEVCTILTQEECLAGGGQYLGDGVPCDPNPCIIPVEHKTWGQIKSNFR